MNAYDATIKELLNAADEALRQFGMEPVVQWLNVELPKVRNPRVDLLGRTATGELVHIELQSSNDPDMPLRMAEYALAILRHYQQYPHQLVLFVGDGAMTMKSALNTHGMSFHYDLIDIRDLDAHKLLSSGHLADNILAVFASMDDSREGVHQILLNIAKLEEVRRNDEIRLLLAAAELRGLQHTVSEEICKVPIIHETSIDDKTFGPWIRKGLEKGRQEAFERAIRIQLKKRFGALPSEIDRCVATLSPEQAEQILLAIVDAKSLEELFPGSANQSSGERNLKGPARRGTRKTRQD
jgi:predicted transposase YdaD